MVFNDGPYTAPDDGAHAYPDAHEYPDADQLTDSNS